MALLDLDPDQAAAVADRHGDGKAIAARVDARDVDALASARSAGADVLVNTASYRVNLDAMRACLRAGCHYLDLGASTGSPASRSSSIRRSSAPNCWRCSGSARARARRT